MILKAIRMLLVCALGLAFAFAQAFAEDNQAPTSVSLGYSETKPGEVEECSGGGLLGAMNCVTKRIEGAGADGNITSTATLGLTITPVLRAQGNSRNVEVWLKVEGGDPAFSGELEAQSVTDVNSDARLVQEKLKRWRKQLSPGELDTLKTKNTLDLTVAPPFEGLKKLVLNNPPAVVTVKVPAYKVEMKFLKKGENGFAAASEITYGEVFIVEVTYTQPQDDPDVFVELNWDGTSLPYEARLSRADNTGTLYRSDELRAGFYIDPKIERAVDPGGR